MGGPLRIESLLACPNDGSPLADLRCTTCGAEYHRGEHGYLELFAAGDPAATLETLASHPATGCERSEDRLYRSYLRPWLDEFDGERVLDAGCGGGLSVAAMRQDGRDAYGIDLPAASEEWSAASLDRDHYVCGNVARLPFLDDSFDAVVCIGVIEHIGTKTGHVTLEPGYDQLRATFAHELLRVVRPGGRILLSCPNKRFPIDTQHGPSDADKYAPWRNRVFARTGLNVHRVVGPYHLPSYSDIRRWFRGHDCRALPLRGFFALTSLHGQPAWVARAANGYLTRLPQLLRKTALNPYVLVEVRR